MDRANGSKISTTNHVKSLLMVRLAHELRVIYMYQFKKEASHVHLLSYLNVIKETEVSDLDLLTLARRLTKTDHQLFDVEECLDYRCSDRREHR